MDSVFSFDCEADALALLAVAAWNPSMEDFETANSGRPAAAASHSPMQSPTVQFVTAKAELEAQEGQEGRRPAASRFQTNCDKSRACVPRCSPEPPLPPVIIRRTALSELDVGWYQEGTRRSARIVAIETRPPAESKCPLFPLLARPLPHSASDCILCLSLVAARAGTKSEQPKAAAPIVTRNQSHRRRRSHHKKKGPFASTGAATVPLARQTRAQEAGLRSRPSRPSRARSYSAKEESLKVLRLHAPVRAAAEEVRDTCMCFDEQSVCVCGSVSKCEFVCVCVEVPVPVCVCMGVSASVPVPCAVHTGRRLRQ